MDVIINIILSLGVFILGVYLIYDTYKVPAVFFSTDLKGYLGGIGMIILSLLSLFGEFLWVDIFTEILQAILGKG